MSKDKFKVVSQNRKASHEYFLEDRYEAGIALTGSEIKSIRAGSVSIREAYIQVSDKEAWLVNAYIAPYDPASSLNHDPRRRRKLLLHKREIRKLYDKVRQRGYTIVPLRMVIKYGLAKVEIALAKGKRRYDKRREIAKRDAEREMARSISSRQ
ncbi:MAG: SsrA-binding protein SmpB [Chloroflexi bacterium]|nr:SsrA-binding protein SmpB [Chloroflexota bacterium]